MQNFISLFLSGLTAGIVAGLSFKIDSFISMQKKRRHIDHIQIESSIQWFNLEIDNLHKKVEQLNQEIEKLKKNEA